MFAARVKMTVALGNRSTSAPADIVFNFGIPGDKPLTGDWNNDGYDTIGVYRGNIFYLRNSNTAGFADISFAFGISGDAPIAGNWDGIASQQSLTSGSTCILDFEGWLVEPELSKDSASLDALLAGSGCDVYLSPEEALRQGIPVESLEVLSEPLNVEQEALFGEEIGLMPTSSPTPTAQISLLRRWFKAVLYQAGSTPTPPPTGTPSPAGTSTSEPSPSPTPIHTPKEAVVDTQAQVKNPALLTSGPVTISYDYDPLYRLTDANYSNGDFYTLLGHKLRIFTLWEAQFVTGGILPL